jgi:tetratricopeptide (TPR) repeat protein
MNNSSRRALFPARHCVKFTRAAKRSMLGPGAWPALVLALACAAGAALTAPPVLAHGVTHEQIERVSREIEREPANARLFLKRATLRHAHRDWVDAQSDFDRAAALAPQWAVVDLERGRMLLDAGRPADARRALDRYVQRAGGDAQGRLERARALRQLGEPLAAVQDYRAALAMAESVEPDVFIDHADALLAAGPAHGREALLAVQEGLSRLGPLVALHLKAAQIEVALGEHAAAAARFERMAEQSARKESWHLRRGDVLAAGQRAQEARAAYAAAIDAVDKLPPHLQTLPATIELKKQAGARLATLP